MRLGLVFIAASLAAQLEAQSSADSAVFEAMRRADPAGTERAVVHRGQVAPDMDLVIAIGGKDIGVTPVAFFFWEERNRLGLFFQERVRPEQVYPVAMEPGSYDCIARVERATATDTVISCTGEKSSVYPHRKFVYDMRSRSLVSYSSFQPVAMRWLLARDSGAVAVSHNADQFLAVDFQAGRNPEFEVLGEADPGAQLAAPPEPAARVLFGPAGRFTWVPESNGPVEQLADGSLMPYPLPLSTAGQLAAARPRQAANLSGLRPNFDDRIGPWQLVGDRLWFGKTFYDSEGSTGVGGFGYFDAASRAYRIFTPPEILDLSVSAILVESGAVWLALVHRGEYGDSGGGVLRYDLQSGSIRKFESPDVIRQFLRVGDRLVFATEQGVSVIYDDHLRRYFADRTADGQWRVIEAVK
jgi:hypothetical protein